MIDSHFYPAIRDYISKRTNEFDQIDPQRLPILSEVTSYLQKKDQPQLNFICTHNSRRSHLGQIWASVAAVHYGIEIQTYSGGTEATAFHPNAIASLKRVGFNIDNPSGGNPKYSVKYADELDPIRCFSKKFEDPSNPSIGFAAIMTCSEADAECPVVFGADERIKLLYNDPKEADGTPQETAVYDDRCAQIARELLFAFSRVK